jgi:hypothetical protein
MDYTRALRGAWKTVWRDRALWAFGVILTLTTGGGTRGGQRIFRQGDLNWASRSHIDLIPELPVNTLIAVGAGLACAIILLAIAATVARYVAETALIRMVDDRETSGHRRTVRQGLRMGWSRSALRVFLIDLVTILPVVLAFMLLFLLAAAPMLVWTSLGLRIAGTGAARPIITVATIVLGLLVLLLAIIAGVILSVLTHFFRRVCVLERAGVVESIRRGYSLARHRLKDVVIMWAIMLGLGIGWMLLMVPVVLLLVIIGAALGGLPALGVGLLSRMVAGQTMSWVLAGVVGIPIFILTMAAPLTFLGGLWEVLKSSVWTLTYRQLGALESLEPG